MTCLFYKSARLAMLITQLVNMHFPNCSLILLQHKLEQGEWAGEIVRGTGILSKYIIFSSVNQSNYMPSFPLTFTTSNYRQHSDKCLVAVMFIDHVSIDFMQQVQNIIAQPYLPMSRKDTDHYIFVADPKIHEKLLRMKLFVSKIKFKVAIGMSSNKEIEIKTIDFFGGRHGAPKLVYLPLEKVLHEKEALFPDFIWNLNGHTMQIVITYARSLIEAELTSQVETNNGKRGRWKYLFEEYLTVKFNFTYRMFPSIGVEGKKGGGGSGFQLSNGTWVGVVGDIYDGRADLGLPIVNTDIRIHYIGFTDSTFDTGCLTFVTGQPSKLYSTFAMFWPFSNLLWTLIISSTIGVLVLFFIATKCLKHLKLEKFIQVNQQVIIILSPFVEQDSPVMPNSNSLRSFIALWSFFTLIVTNVYRSKLVTLLAFPVVGNLPKTFEELAFSDFQVGFMKNGDSAYSTFSRSKDPVYEKLTQRMEVFKGVNITCLEKVVRNEKYACIAYDFDVIYLQQKNFSDAASRKLIYSNARTYNIWMGLATEAQSIYRVNFGKVLGQTMPFHLAQVWDSMDMYTNVRKPTLKWWAETNQTHQVSEDNESTSDLTLNKIQGVFVIFMYCVFACLVVFFNEFYACSRFRSKDSKCSRSISPDSPA